MRLILSPGAAQLIAKALREIEGIEDAYLYGSFARNHRDAASDIDVLVMGAPDGQALANAVGKLERRLGREINYTVMTKREFRLHRARKDAFLESIWQNRPVLLLTASEKDQAPHR